MRQTSAKGIIFLLLTALIWGVSFVAQSVGAEVIGPFTYNGIRTLMGGVVLAFFILVRTLIRKRRLRDVIDQDHIRKGLVLGLIFTVASNFQQFAFEHSTAGKIAFITALYIFFVPIIGTFMRKKVHPLTWLCVAASIAGLYLLSVKDGDLTSINTGDVLALICALCFAIHIIFIDRYSEGSDGISLSAVQFLVAGSITCVLMFIFEKPAVSGICDAAVPLLYSGLMSCGVAYTFQIMGQKYTNPVVASLLMSLESVFAVLAAALLLQEIPSLREGIGCVIMFAAIIASQVIEFITKKPSHSQESQ